MTFDEVLEVIMFVIGGLVLVWAFRSLAFASSGGERSGMHELGAPSVGSNADSEAAPEPEPEEVAAAEAASYQRRHRFHQLANYALSMAAMAALTAMLIGAWLA